MRYYLAAPLLLAAALLQASALSSFPILGVYPNLVLVLVVSWTVVRGQREGMIVVPLGGLCLGLFSSEPVGVALLAAAPVVLLAELREARLTQSDFLLALLLVLVSSMVYETVFLVSLRVMGESVQWWGSFLRVTLPAAIVNVLFTPPLYWLVWWRSTATRRVRSY
jgi:rod shape-determining protein MreD